MMELSQVVAASYQRRRCHHRVPPCRQGTVTGIFLRRTTTIRSRRCSDRPVLLLVSNYHQGTILPTFIIRRQIQSLLPVNEETGCLDVRLTRRIAAILCKAINKTSLVRSSETSTRLGGEILCYLRQRWLGRRKTMCFYTTVQRGLFECELLNSHFASKTNKRSIAYFMFTLLQYYYTAEAPRPGPWMESMSMPAADKIFIMAEAA